MGNAGDATNPMGPFRPARRRYSRFARLGQLAAASCRDLSGPVSLHHNLIATCRDRHASLSRARNPPRHIVDFRNNFIDHWTTPGTTNFCDYFINCINNVWRPGPSSKLEQLPIAMKGSLPDLAQGYMSGNVFEGRGDAAHAAGRRGRRQ